MNTIKANTMTHYFLRFPIVLFGFLLALFAYTAQATPTITLPQAGQWILPIQKTPTRIAVANPTVLAVQTLTSNKRQPNEILLTGLKPGTTELRIWFNHQATPSLWTIHVEHELTHQLKQQEGYLPQIELYSSTDQSLISGHANSLLEHQIAHQTALSHTTLPPLDTSTVGTTGMVQIEVQIAELSSSVLKSIGIDWQGGKQGGNWDFSSPSNIVSNGFNIIFDGSKHFSARLQLLQSNNLARILAEPTLVALSGQSASFLSGGSIPVPIAGGLGTQGVEYKDFGIGLTISPTILSNQRIALKVAPEASDLDYSNAISSNGTSVPALRVRKTDTFVELGDGESFIISGLVSRTTRANVNKMPLLGDLPIIGSFFRSMEYEQEERELVIIVTPRLVRPLTADTQITLPGQGSDRLDNSTNAWGAYLMGPAIGQNMPGFSR